MGVLLGSGVSFHGGGCVERGGSGRVEAGISGRSFALGSVGVC